MTRKDRSHSIQIVRDSEAEFAADLPAISCGIRDVFAQNRIAALNARQSVFAIGARRSVTILLWLEASDP
jgi:hypothetical protein